MAAVSEKDGFTPSFFSYVFVFLIFSPFLASYALIFDWVNPHDHQRTLAIFSAISLFVVASSKSVVSVWFDGFYLKLLISLIFWLSLVSVFSEMPFWSFVELSYVSNLLMLSLVIAIYFEDGISWLLKATVVLLILFFLLYYVNLIVGILYLASATGRVDAGTLVSGYANFRFLNQVQVFLFLFLLFGRNFFGKSARVLIFGILAFTVLILLITTARGAILSILLVVSIFFIYDRNSREVIWFFIGAIAAGAVLYFLLVLALDVVSSLNPMLQGDSMRGLKLDSTSGRIEMWLESLYLAPKHLFFGVGGLHYPLVSDLNIGAHPHNILFQFAIEWGYGITAVIVLIVLSAWRLNVEAIRDFWSAGNDFIYRPFFCSFFGLLLYSMFSGVLSMPLGSQSFIFALSGVIHFFRKLSFQTHGELRSISSFRLRILAVGVSLLVYWGLMFPQVYSVLSGQMVYGKPFPTLYAPRLWLDGVIR